MATAALDLTCQVCPKRLWLNITKPGYWSWALMNGWMIWWAGKHQGLMLCPEHSKGVVY